MPLPQIAIWPDRDDLPCYARGIPSVGRSPSLRAGSLRIRAGGKRSLRSDLQNWG